MLAGLDTAPSHRVKPPRIAQSPVSLECVNHASMVTGPYQTIVVGRILAIHIEDRHILDAARGHVDTPGLDLVGRMFGANYIRTHDKFALERPNWADWSAANPERAGAGGAEKEQG